jgi:hypothetical protein
MEPSAQEYHRDERIKRELLVDIRDNQTNGNQKVQVSAGTVANSSILNVDDTAHVSSGSVASGALAIEIITSEDFTGTINGVSIPQLAVKTYPYIPGYVYPELTFIITAGTLYINTLRP